MANGGLARMRQHQQQAAGPEVYMRAAFSSKQARGNDRPGTPWASVPGEWLLLLPCDEAVMRRLQALHMPLQHRALHLWHCYIAFRQAIMAGE
jgi:hypothetical protein